MTPQELKETLTAEQIDRLRAVCTKTDDLSDDDAQTLDAFLCDIAAPALGEDQIAEPYRYITASAAGLRPSDLTALIGEEDFDAAVFADFNHALGFPVFVEQTLPTGEMLYTFHPQMRAKLQQKMDATAKKSCAADIGYYLLGQCSEDDAVRNSQTLILLYVAEEPVAAAEFISQAKGPALQGAVVTTGNLLKSAPDAVKETVWQMLAAEGEKVSHARLLSLMVNDIVGVLGKPDLVLPHVQRLHDTVQQMLPAHPELTVYYGLAKLRAAQAYRLLRQEKEAQQWFGQGINFVLAQIDAAPLPLTPVRIGEFWNALKICQDMAQPKGMDVIFKKLVERERKSIETCLAADTEADTASQPERPEQPTPTDADDASLPEQPAASDDATADDAAQTALAETLMMQFVDMSKTWASMPQPLQEQMTDYTDETITMLRAYIEQAKAEGDTATPSEAQRRANLHQILGELLHRKERDEESYEALTEAQILQMRILADCQRQDGADKMSHEQLMARLALSVTNHMLADHYRRSGRGQHDLSIVLRSNLDLATECFRFYPRDGRVIHFIINAALELGDMQHQSRGLLAECGTYEKVLTQLQPQLNNLRLDQQLAVDVAMIHTKAGQAQADNSIRRYKNAKRNLGIAQQLWGSLAQNTKNEQFRQNADNVAKMLKQLK